MLRPLVVEIVRVELDLRLAELERDDDSYLTTVEYAERFKTTHGAVLARIRRGTLHAIKPPGSREWLIPVDPADQGYDHQQIAPATGKRPGA